MATSIEIPSRTLGRTGVKVSLLGFGAEAIGRAGRTLDDAQRTLRGVRELGVTLVDTASAYGQSEAFIGRALAEQREQFTLVTKCGWTGNWQPAWSSAQLAETIEHSLAHLHCDVIDVLLLHSCPLETLQQGDVIEAIRRAKQQGKARFIGYSGDNQALAYAIDQPEVDVIETSFSLLDQANAATIAAANRRGIGVLLKRPLANAVPGRAEKPHSEYAAQYWSRWQEFQRQWKQNSDAAMEWLDTAARFSAYWPGVDCALVGSSRVEHVAQIAQALERGPLPHDLTARLVNTFRSVGEGWLALG